MPGAKLLSRLPQLAGVLLLLVIGTNYLVFGRDVMPNSSRECAICHIRWIQALERNDTQGDRMEEVLDRQAGSGDMCLSCHDGSVVDSRFKVWSTRHHTTDSVPSPAVNIPTETFPLDSEGRMTCATCHTAHAVPDSSDLKTVIFLRKPNVDSSLCLSCHPQHAQKNEFQHPLGEADFAIPQEILAAGGKTSADGKTVICQTCHEPHGARNEWMLVLPPSKLCIACHTDKSPEATPPAGAPVHHIGYAYAGFEPPDSLLDERATFGSNGELSCLSCHRLHDASGAKPLLIRKNEDSSLCLDCHKKEKAVIESRHDLRFSSPETVNAKGQTASQSGPCGACHRIHGWARDVPETHRPHSSGCMECHQSGGPGNVNRPYFDAHTVGVPVPEGMPEQLPLDEATGSIGCLTCHDPHSPRSSKGGFVGPDPAAAPGQGPTLGPLSAAVSIDKKESRIHEPRSFLRQDGSNLCVLCHDKLTDLPTRPHDPNAFSSQTREVLAVHPSVGPCRVCHTTHNAQGPHLWARQPASDAGRIADLCGSCHDDKLGAQDSVHDPEISKWAKDLAYISMGSCLDCHPVHDPNEQGGIWGAIPGRNELPWSCETCHREGAPGKAMETAHMGKTLGIELVNPPQNMKLGADRKIVCTTCHDIHQRDRNAKLLAAPVPDLCDICHEGKLNVRHSVHDTTEADWAKELGLESKGSCIDCHPIHGARGKEGVWALIGGESNSAQTCESCHRTEGPGKIMETPHIGKTVTGELKNLPDNMPAGPDGKIQCMTCHDIHGAGGNPKLLAFARNDSGICLVCHQQAAELVKSFHDLRISAPDARNLRGETAGQSGPCGACHVIHPNDETGGVWAQSLPSPFGTKTTVDAQDEYGRGFCTCCHRQDQCASERIPKNVDHPAVSLLNRIWHKQSPGVLTEQPGYMPTFDKSGKLSPIGTISCLTCHEPHAAAVVPNAQSEFPLSRRRMFLRPQAKQRLCIDCHGIEALWLFLHFHEEKRNP